MPSIRRQAARTREDNETYEIVQLLRINGAQIRRANTKTFTLRLGGKGNWNECELTVKEIKQRYGQGTIGYKALRTHQRADRVPVAKTKRKIESIVFNNGATLVFSGAGDDRLKSQHMDLA